MMGIGAAGWDVSRQYAAWQPVTVRTAAPQAQPETPVQPVQAAKPVSAENGAARPLGRQLPVQLDFDPAEKIGRASCRERV